MKVLAKGTIFLNTSLTESFGIAILEAACAGLYVVATRVGGVSEILPPDMISFALPEEDGKICRILSRRRTRYTDALLDIVRAMSEAISRVSAGKHDPWHAHKRVREFYNWQQVAERTEKAYDYAMKTEQPDLWVRIKK